jgi:hypothetical protein
MTVQDIRNAFETAAHSGYVGYGLSMTDGYYAPEPLSSTRSQLHRAVPLTADYFRYQTDFHPTDEQIAEYNATFEVGASWKPDHLDLAVAWQTKDGLKWRTYEVTGTRHAYYLLRKLVQRRGFRSGRLQEWLVDGNGYAHENVISLDADDITGSDRHGKGRSLLDRNNSHYDLERDLKEHRAQQDELDRQETQSDRDAWYDQDR